MTSIIRAKALCDSFPREVNSPRLGICQILVRKSMTQSRLTRSALRWTTLSSASPQRGFGKRKENPLYARSGERGDERSDVGVSRLRAICLPHAFSEITTFLGSNKLWFTL